MDSLWAGTPWLTVPGEWMVGRFGASALAAVGIGSAAEAISTLKQYEDAVAGALQ